MLVASVPTAVEGDVLPERLHGFTPRADLVALPAVYNVARARKVDLVASHYGHHSRPSSAATRRGDLAEGVSQVFASTTSSASARASRTVKPSAS